MPPTESGHWYALDGSPRHWQPVKSRPGETRPTTIRDARTQKLLPSVTTILNVLAKPALNDWRVREAVKLAFDFTRDGLTAEAFAELVMEAAYAPVQAAADEGSRIHHAVEASFLPGGVVPDPYAKHVHAVRDALTQRFPTVGRWVSESRVVNLAHGYAGTCDLYAQDAPIVVDFKCKDFADHTKRMAYDQHLQLAAYAAALGCPLEQTRLANVFISRTVPGLVVLHEWTADPKFSVVDSFHTFATAAHLWRLLNRYDPRQVAA